MIKADITQSRLCELLHYAPDTGEFIWKVQRGHKIKPGSVAGSKNVLGYIELRVDDKLYLAHRLAFLHVEGYLPEYQVDHKNGHRHDNRWANLRHVTQTCNSQNQMISPRNTSGVPGVSWTTKRYKWQAYMMLHQKKIHLGYYIEPLEAALARFTAEVQCSEWTCNYRGELVNAIKRLWPEFKPKHA